MPVVYEVALDADPDRVAALERYMIEQHIPEVFATGCFRTIRFERAGAMRFRTRYEAASQADLDRYLAHHTARLRAGFSAHFPEGVRLSREVWMSVADWPGQEFGSAVS
ncbi:MAG TPA: DUF4286 family protein [Gemmatimonadales bacterium]|nr:DUF4286 family protein [Gemmatimonadales bacterium]